MNGTIKRLRVRRGLTQVELAKRAGIARGYLAQLEAGDRAVRAAQVLAQQNRPQLRGSARPVELGVDLQRIDGSVGQPQQGLVVLGQPLRRLAH